jgi:hypothetical protein
VPKRNTKVVERLLIGFVVEAESVFGNLRQ